VRPRCAARRRARIFVTYSENWRTFQSAGGGERLRGIELHAGKIVLRDQNFVEGSACEEFLEIGDRAG
jgi:hypothetical protein